MNIDKGLDKKKVLLGLSGGVDSTAAVLILKEKGYEVTGYYFDVQGDNFSGIEKAKKIASELGIEIITEDVSKNFDEVVIENFCSEFTKGKTPNPCIVCNPNIKFKKLIDKADEIGAYYIATGHYARIFEDDKGDLFIRKGKNYRKDQSYMLYRLNQDIIKRIIFPLGIEEDKYKVREFVKENKISNAEDDDSQEICFIDDEIGYKDYLKERGYNPLEGNFIDSSGVVLGKHKGISNYTIGQRKGLGIALGKPAFVLDIDENTGNITLGSNEELFRDTVISTNNIFAIEKEKIDEDKIYYGKIRYMAKPAKCKIRFLEDGKLETKFFEKERAITPGQSIVIYDGEKVLGGGFITKE